MLDQHTIKQIVYTARQFPAIERIYVFGSQAGSGSMKKRDIDLALEAAAMSETELYQFSEQVQQAIRRLLSLDIGLIDDDGFRQHVRKSGQLIYGVELDVQVAVSRWQRALTRLRAALDWRARLPVEQHFLAIGSIFWYYRQAFDLGLKMVKKVLRYKGITAGSPRDLLIEAHLQHWLAEEKEWLRYLAVRVRLDEIIYDADRVVDLADALQSFPDSCSSMLNTIREQIPGLSFPGE